MKRFMLLLVACLISIGTTAQAAVVLSDNLVTNGDFESLDNLKNDTSPDGVPPHRFSQEYDFDTWLSHWGPPNNPGGLGGFSTYDDPRDVGETGGNTRNTGNLGNFNRSVDPLDPNNHIMETVMFRPSMTMWIKAPENHVPGPIHFSFDFMMENGHTYSEWGRVFVYGMHVMPPHDYSFFNAPTPGAPSATWVLDDTNPDDGDVLFMSTYGDWIHGSTNGEDPPFEYFGKWWTYSTTDYMRDEEDNIVNEDGTIAYQWWGGHTINKEIAQTYEYYVVAVYPVVYDETDPYWWLYSPDARIADGFVFGYDNFVLQLSVDEGAVVPDPVPADFSIDSLVNTEDINPFILALTNTTAWLNYARPLLPDGLTDQQIIDYADPNGDGSINTEDIAWFICWLTTPGSCGGGGGGAIIPEPASLGLLGLGALALLRRRR